MTSAAGSACRSGTFGTWCRCRRGRRTEAGGERDDFRAADVARSGRRVFNYDSDALMIRSEKVQAWMARLRPLTALLATRFRTLTAAAGLRAQRGTSALRPRIEEAASAVDQQVRPLGPALENRLRQAAAAARPTLASARAGAIPTAARVARAIQRELEAGRDARATPRQLRDARGRRLRASAYNCGPDNRTIRVSPRRAHGVAAIAGGLLPAGVKVGLVALLVGFAFLGSSSAYINYAADLPDAHAITSQPLDEDSLVYAGHGTMAAGVPDPPKPQHYYE